MMLETCKTVAAGYLNIVASNFDARPMSYVDGDKHLGYEPDVTRAVCQRLGLEPVWHNLPMAEFYSSLKTGRYDLVWFNQAITAERQAWADFTRPYGLFDEAVLVRADSPVTAPADLAGLRVGGLADSTNLALAASFGNAEIIPFPGSDQVLPEMLEALRAGEIDALIDDELVLLVAAEEDPNLKIGFSVPTRVPFAIAVRPGQPELVDTLNHTLESLIADGTLAQLWAEWIPWKPFPF
jgi:ABC-type amino acid transport substrate-binding protein